MSSFIISKSLLFIALDYIITGVLYYLCFPQFSWYSLVKSSYLIYQGVISTLSPDSANLFLNLLLGLVCIFKDDKLKKFLFQTCRFSGHLHFGDLLFMSRYFYKVVLLVIYSLFFSAYSVFPGLKMSLPVLRACTPPPLHHHAPSVLALGWSTQAFLFLLSHPAGSSEETSPTLQPLVGAIYCSQPNHPPLSTSG